MAEKIIRVRAAPHRKDDDRAILNDQDDAHPGGHVLIVGTDRKAFEVGDTARVRELLASGDLVLVDEKPAKEPSADVASKP